MEKSWTISLVRKFNIVGVQQKRRNTKKNKREQLKSVKKVYGTFRLNPKWQVSINI